MSSTTPNFGWILPGVNDPTDQDLWGGYLNSNLSNQDTVLKTIQDASQGSTSAKTSNYTLLSTDRNSTILVDASGGPVTITADATLGNGFAVNIIKTDTSSNAVIFAPLMGQTVNGNVSEQITSQYNDIAVVSNGSNWFSAGNASGVSFASASDTLAGVSAILALTPAGLAGNKSLSANGYYQLPGGLTIQWGSVTIGNAPTTTSFPISFPSTCASIAASLSSGINWSVTATTQTNFTANTGNATTGLLRWIAIGY